MTAITITRFGGPDVLRPVTLPTPQPGPGEVLIRVAAAGLNAPDLGQRRGTYNPPPDASPLPGSKSAATSRRWERASVASSSASRSSR